MNGGVEQPGGDLPPEPVLGTMKFPAWPEITGAIAAVVPLIVTAESYSTQTSGGKTEVTSYSNLPATLGGAVAAVCGVIALVLVAKTVRERRVARIAAGIVLLAAGGLQLARGQGVFFDPGGGDTAGSPRGFSVADSFEPREEELWKAWETCRARDDDAACAKGVPYAREQCEQGELYVCNQYGLALLDGRTGSVDHGGALAAFSRACEGGNAEGCTNLSVQYYQGKGVPRDVDRAAELATKGCDAGNGTSCRNLGIIMRDERDDHAAARAAFQRSCEVSDSDAMGCNLYGVALYRGYGGPEDHAAAREAYIRSCDLGNPDGCGNLALFARDGEGGPADPALQRRAWTRGCELDAPDACNDAGVMYFRGSGGDHDSARAAQMFARACELGHGLGCSNLGEMHRDGTGVPDVPSSAEKANELFARGCELESSRACFMLGELRRSAGADTAGDAYRRACELGHEQACKKVR